ncbi:hypothetical protein Tco_1392721 [Tanacetum coccineum]
MLHSPILHYILEEELGVSSAVTSGGAAIKVPYFKNRSTTTIILPLPSEFGKHVIKSMETLSHGPLGIGSVLKGAPLRPLRARGVFPPR